MSEEKTKTCVMCGKTIPAYSNFCPYCGAKQPWLEEDEIKNPDVKRILKWYQKPFGKLVTYIVAFLMIMAVGSMFTLHDGPSHKTIQRELNQYLFNSRTNTPFGKKPKIKVDKNKGTSIKISKSSQALKDLKNNKPATWNQFVVQVQRRSSSFHNVYVNQMYSKITVTAKKNKKLTYLKVNQGKVTYNVADHIKK